MNDSKILENFLKVSLEEIKLFENPSLIISEE